MRYATYTANFLKSLTQRCPSSDLGVPERERARADTKCMRSNPDNETTQVIPRVTLAQVAAQAHAENALSAPPASDRPTRDLLSPARARATTVELPHGWRAGDPPLSR